MPSFSLVLRTARTISLTGTLILVAGCGTPREAMTPTLDSGPATAAGQVGQVGPTSRLDTVAPPALTAVAGGTATHFSQLPADLQEAWRRSRLPESAVSVVVAEVGQPPMVSINPEQPRNPASVMKLVTTYAALEGLGPGYTWKTDLVLPPGARVASDGTVNGPIHIRAGGDPDIRIEDAWQMLRELRLRGVRSVQGFVIDRSRYGAIGIDTNEFDGAGDRVYNASPDAMMVGFGAVRLLYYPDLAAGRWKAVLDPVLPGVRVENKVRATQGACPGAPAIRTRQRNEPTGINIEVTGTVALSCGDFTAYRLALTQPQHTAAVLQQMWRDLGGTLNGPIIDGPAPANGQVLVSHTSRTLAEQIRTVNKFSNNVMARMMLLALGAEHMPGMATPESGAAALRRVFADQGLDFPELRIENGSGLSRDGRISANSLARMLHAAYLSPRMPEFVASMAIAGEDGTVRRRWRNDGAAGRAHLKTGTLRDVSALAGYVRGASGRHYLLVSMANDSQAFNLRTFNDQLVAWLAGR
ncbi:D-alanyl-D-alanine carboxypeptidase/D-alanyl-D-alanine-endopeptidase [Verticiella sediminum]|uniref:D-alanyl-D-alanine carboxypeptidase/D-alanyl-D-alanine-endopeptidase n=1 Tax=Verticiella sediminum TaxID=1247510 RepID=A0A556AVP1_9BURK|nr:D-alanyl-D-alanine carboxypeptidase/D-alanyl-D-alanine-endopeptidase [Verticiella sediminum]TSH97019.1 D-alanyl-D-alanine carboxypeptidase/D-alanyl-D-alanine-endopeptidase [Verticiella sediminum]